MELCRVPDDGWHHYSGGRIGQLSEVAQDAAMGWLMEHLGMWIIVAGNLDIVSSDGSKDYTWTPSHFFTTKEAAEDALALYLLKRSSSELAPSP